MKSIVVLTGAGISAESGLKTFRDVDGLWRGNHVEDIATREAFGRNAVTVHEFYNERRRNLQTVEPNIAHLSLAKLEHVFKEKLTLITQNVDDLHERAGSASILHMHGQILRKICTWCGASSECLSDIQQDHVCESCVRSGGLRPDVVWFGETPYHMDEIEPALRNADTFVSIGTSGHVYPAARFVEIANLHGATSIEVNREETKLSENFNRSLIGNATEMVPQLVEELLLLS